MSTYAWDGFRQSMKFPKGESRYRPDEQAIRELEQKAGVRLPKSYCEFMKGFGPGVLGNVFEISAPGYGRGELFDLWSLSRSVHETKTEADAYSPDPAQHDRFLFFARDVAVVFYAWDPNEVTNSDGSEFAIYAQFRDWEVQRLASSFFEFITEVAVGPRHAELYEDPPKLTFVPPYGDYDR